MPDFDIKDIEKLNARIKLYERIRIALFISLPAAMHYDVQPVTFGIVLFIVIISFAKSRLSKELKAKESLAKAVEERTIELRVQRDQVLMESEKLSVALAALAEAQDELVRNERYATVGQLTKGLVDRILNPLNYINNFAGLSIGLIKDLERSLRGEQASTTKELYAETMEVLAMVNGNLEKITEHGANTVRIVKAMEELLKDQKGKMVSADINNLCKVNIDVVSKLYANEIEEHKIQITFQGLILSLMIDMNIELMSKVLLHLFKNSLHALMKKAAKQQAFEPELTVSLQKHASTISITIHDNGIGIEESIIDKVFEPFFTTKPTAEAAGIGLYISREVILNHRGSITVKSEKDQFTEFTIIIPIHQNIESYENG